MRTKGFIKHRLFDILFSAVIIFTLGPLLNWLFNQLFETDTEFTVKSGIGCLIIVIVVRQLSAYYYWRTAKRRKKSEKEQNEE